jgi:hypothetical protein
MERQMLKNIKTAVLFAVSFILLAVVINLRHANIHWAFQLLAIIAYGLLLFKLFSQKDFITFAGFSVMLLGLNYIWTDPNIESIWKVSASIVVLLQLGTLGEENNQTSV